MTPTGKRRVRPSEMPARRAEAERRRGWGKLVDRELAREYITRTSVAVRRWEADRLREQNRRRYERNLLPVGIGWAAYTGGEREPKYISLTDAQMRWAMGPGWDGSRRPQDDLLGCGSFGCAFKRPDGDVFKITSDASDIAALLAAQGHRRVVTLRDVRSFPVLAPESERTPGEMHHHAAGKVRRLYGAVVEPLSPLDHGREGFVRRLKEGKRWLAESYDESPHRGRPSYRVGEDWRDEFLRACAGAAIPTAERDACREMGHQIIRVHEHLGRRGLNFYDVHPGNFGMRRSGEWAILDVGHSGGGAPRPPPKVRTLRGLFGVRTPRRR